MTSQKTEKKRISSKIFVALAALTLVSCCFLGTTFARYTTGTTSGSAGADIADWEIVVEDGSSGSATGEFLVIQPVGQGQTSDDAITADIDRINEIPGSGAVISITNKGQVKADVTVEIDTSSYTYYVKDYEVNGGQVVIENGRYKWTEAKLDSTQPDKLYYDQEGREYKWDFTNNCPLYFDGQNWKADAWWTAAGNLETIIEPGTLSIIGASADSGNTYTATLATNGTVQLKITGATWTTEFVGEKVITDAGYPQYTFPGDLRDTWIGENLLKVGYTFTLEAVQSAD